MAYDDKDKGRVFPTRTGVATGSANERTMLDVVGASGIRTQIRSIIGPDGRKGVVRLRTRGGSPEFVAEFESEGSKYEPHTDHGLIIDDLLTYYSETANTPNGYYFTLLQPPAGWGDSASASHYRHGHTVYIDGIQLDQNSANFWTAVSNAIPGGNSLLFGMNQFYSPKVTGESADIGRTTWLYQTPAGRKLWMRLYFTIPNPATDSVRNAGQTWTVTTRLIYYEIFSNGTYGAEVEVFRDVDFTVTNTRDIALFWDNAAIQGSYVPQVFEGVNVSPTGDQAVLNFLVQPTESSTAERYCAKTMLLTLTETGATIAGAWTVDLDEAACFIDHPQTNTGIPGTPIVDDSAVSTVFNDGNGLLFTGVWSRGNTHQSSGYTLSESVRWRKILLVRGFEPRAGASTLTGLWFKSYVQQRSEGSSELTYSGSSWVYFPFDGSPPSVGGAKYEVRDYSHLVTSNLLSYTIFKDSDEVIQFRKEESTPTGGDVITITSGGSGGGGWTGVSGSIKREIFATVNGVDTLIGGSNAAAASFSTVSGVPEPLPTYVGDFNRIEIVEDDYGLRSNNCAVISAIGRWETSIYGNDPNTWATDANQYRMILAAGLGMNRSLPAAYKFPWRISGLSEVTPSSGLERWYTEEVAWNPRKPMLFGIVSTENTFVFPYVSVRHSVTWI